MTDASGSSSPAGQPSSNAIFANAPEGWPVPLRCSFCGADQHAVDKLIAGPHPLMLCSGCVRLCAAIMEEDGLTVTEAPARTAAEEASKVYAGNDASASEAMTTATIDVDLMLGKAIGDQSAEHAEIRLACIDAAIRATLKHPQAQEPGEQEDYVLFTARRFARFVIDGAATRIVFHAPPEKGNS